MRSRLFSVFCGPVVAFSQGTAMFAQEASAQEKMAKQGDGEGVVIRSDPDKSTLTVFCFR
jgi:hypothetical protein